MCDRRAMAVLPQARDVWRKAPALGGRIGVTARLFPKRKKPRAVSPTASDARVQYGNSFSRIGIPLIAEAAELYFTRHSTS